MAKTLTVRMDEGLSMELTSCLDALGLTANAYFNLAARQLVTQGRVPFDIIVPADVPNEETHAAIVRSQAKELGILSDDAPSFDSAEAAMAYLES